nr:MAG TPA: hypothetical protein [Caudoviricetes sp.]
MPESRINTGLILKRFHILHKTISVFWVHSTVVYSIPESL